MKNTFKTLILSLVILTTTAAQASLREVDLDVNDQPKVETMEPGYSMYVRGAPASELDSAVNLMPEFSDPALFMSEEGLFRYAYYEKTNVWLTREAAEKAMMETTDLGNW